MSEPRPLDLNEIPEEDGVVYTHWSRERRASNPQRVGRAYVPPEDEHGTLTEEREDDWQDDDAEERIIRLSGAE